MSRPSAVIVGAGILGGMLALTLVDEGWDVTLVDRFPPGHARASSGGESRTLRCAHGSDAWHARSAWQSTRAWRALQERLGSELLVQPGAGYFVLADDTWEAESEATLRAEGIPVERLGPEEAAARYPGLVTDGIASVLFEPAAGLLRARRATQAVAAEAIAGGARFVSGTAVPRAGAVEVDGDVLEADRVVWACGPWLGALFPGLADVRPTKQDIFYLGGPPGMALDRMPLWLDRMHQTYGSGDLAGRGIKVNCDAGAIPFDPDSGRRVASEEREREVRAYLERRFPALAQAPLLGTEVCQYEMTGDANFILAPHPEHERSWVMGGGSGHAFKHAPVLAQTMRDLIAGTRAPEARFGLGMRERLVSGPFGSSNA